MAPCQIRRYQDQDWHVVRAIFADGMMQQVADNFWYQLKQPRSFLLLLGGPGALLLGCGSLLLSLLALLGLLAILWLVARYPFSYYVDHALHTDMWDIRASYLNNKGSCFWVAESEGQAVGLVCACPAREVSGTQKDLELLHLSVRRDHRGQGIAKILVQTVLHFAQDKGYNGVVLTTASLNYPARRLYESLGFWKSHETMKALKWSIAIISLAHYKYTLSLSS
ncbi:N-acetyltransferase 8B-like [Phascolarctos cinereus]|uniref:N-acetyltransferase 8B n=1 Tax=Phascolarctos cinereus TaxID=38626 RepID=A0A6P5LJH2_PHACI|nr:putative N-acetyltransferase 8B [Phascolarctos cinereus]XP_020856725.1 putative N-acetyltransferase 8B [Phascolarctos cinereus]XP_020856726.1 putative N-acetyltransferase 8B [Phascolarctos cinereus]